MTYTGDIIESSYLPATKSAQQVELIALAQACQLAKTQIVNAYILAVVMPLEWHTTLDAMEMRAFNLFLDSLQKQVAVIKCYTTTKTVGNY